MVRCAHTLRRSLPSSAMSLALLFLVPPGCKPDLAEAGASPRGGTPPAPPHPSTAAASPDKGAPPGGAEAKARTGAAQTREDQFREKVAAECLGGLREITTNALVVQAVAEANRTNQQSQQEIDAKDRKWRQTPGIDDALILPYLTNPCAAFLKEAQRAHPEYLELFVMDRKGCIVAESNKTSDYWQGDEDKWIQSFNGGKGKVFVDEITYDESTHAYVVQISVPVFDAQGQTIGALTASIQAHGER